MNRKEALRYLENAKDSLRTSLVEDNRYIDEKYVKSGCGIAYLGVLKAIDDHLIRNGVSRKALPKKVEEYEKALKEYASPHNGKLLGVFRDIYDELHIAGYYRGNLHSVETGRGALKTARSFIEELG